MQHRWRQGLGSIMIVMWLLGTFPNMAISQSSQKNNSQQEEDVELTPDDQLTWNTRLRGYIPAESKIDIAGFTGQIPNSLEIGFTFIYPINPLFGIGGGFSHLSMDVSKKKNRRFFTTNSFSTKDLKADASFTAYLFEIAFDYKGFSIGKRIIILTTALEFPIAGNGSVTSQITTQDHAAASIDSTGSVVQGNNGGPVKTTETKDASSAQGYGLFQSLGLTLGKKWEIFLYYRQRQLNYDLKIPNIVGSPSDAVIDLTEIGLGAGIVF